MVVRLVERIGFRVNSGIESETPCEHARRQAQGNYLEAGIISKNRRLGNASEVERLGARVLRVARAGERMPAEDVRRAIAHQNVDAGIYGAHLMAKANREALEKRVTARRAAVNARQSLLRFQDGAG